MTVPPGFCHDTRHAATATLSACLGAARSDAQRFFGRQLPPAWKPRARRQTRWCLLGALALATGGVAATVWQRQALLGPPAVATQAPRPAAHPALLWDQPGSTAAVPMTGNAFPATLPSATPPAAPLPAQRQSVFERLDGGEFRIHLVAHDRHAAAQRLAALTGARLLERPEALMQTRPVTLRWQGRDSAGAWRALLADEAQYLLDCRVQNACKVWIVGADSVKANGGPPASPATAALLATPANVEAVAPVAAPGPALQPDPPGLFPSE
jgi:hypothetical protein